MLPLLPGEAIITRIWDLFFPDKTAVTKADFELKAKAIDAEITRLTLASQERAAQAATNTAEAANPNRKWATWRELIGYACAYSIWYMWIIQPTIVVISQLVGHPLNPDNLIQINVVDVLTLAMGMLGISYTPSAVQAVSNVVSKIKNRGK